MNIEELTIKQARELAAIFGGSSPSGSKRLPIHVGEALHVRTITAFFTGRVTAVAENEIELTDAAWIADEGRAAQAWKTGEFSEVEPFPDGDKIVLNRDTFVTVRRLTTALPRSQK
jgi:hypothetical protein